MYRFHCTIYFLQNITSWIEEIKPLKCMLFHIPHCTTGLLSQHWRDDAFQRGPGWSICQCVCSHPLDFQQSKIRWDAIFPAREERNINRSCNVLDVTGIVLLNVKHSYSKWQSSTVVLVSLDVMTFHLCVCVCVCVCMCVCVCVCGWVFVCASLCEKCLKKTYSWQSMSDCANQSGYYRTSTANFSGEVSVWDLFTLSTTSELKWCKDTQNYTVKKKL
jgi:hypothetical protein